MITPTTTATAAGTSKGSRLAPALDRKLAGPKPLFDVAAWYTKSKSIVLTLDERLKGDCSANEIAALNLSFQDFQSEAEVTTRVCECLNRRGDVCECYARPRSVAAWLRRLVHCEQSR
jgi:hypothetical protein